MKIAIYLFCLLLGFCAPKKSVPKTNFTFETVGELDTKLKEASGITKVGQSLFVLNDTDLKPSLYKVNTSGKILKTHSYDNITNIDWEDLIFYNGHYYISDTGNNSGLRKNLRIIRLNQKELEVNKPNFIKYRFLYKDQNDFKAKHQNHPYDCEAMVVLDEDIYLFSKDWVNFTTDIYKVDTKTKEKQSLTSLQNLDVDGLITGATVNEDGHVVLCGYQSNLSAFVVFLTYNKGKFNLIQRYETPIVGAQIEGITYYGKDPSGKNIYYLVSESMDMKRGKIKLKQPGRLYRLTTNL